MDRRWNDGGAITTGYPVAGELAGSSIFFFDDPTSLHLILCQHTTLSLSRATYIRATSSLHFTLCSLQLPAPTPAIPSQGPKLPGTKLPRYSPKLPNADCFSACLCLFSQILHASILSDKSPSPQI
jgi:hypothetical protein